MAVAFFALGMAAAVRAQTPAFAAISDAPAAAIDTAGETSSLPSSPRPANIQALSTVHLAAIESVRPVRQTSIEKLPSRKSWIILSLVQHGAAGFDAYSTRQAIGNGAVEQDPFMRPFANSGAIYGAIQVAPLALDYVARRMQLSHRNLVRRLWWVPQTTSTSLFLFSGAHNMRIASE